MDIVNPVEPIITVKSRNLIVNAKNDGLIKFSKIKIVYFLDEKNINLFSHKTALSFNGGCSIKDFPVYITNILNGVYSIGIKILND